MASSSSSSTSGGPIARGSRRRRLVLKLSQKDTLQALFQQNPYPGIATRERLARELGIAESRVQVWFQNQRRRRLKQSRSPSANMRQDGEGAPGSTARPPSTPRRPQSSTQDRATMPPGGVDGQHCSPFAPPPESPSGTLASGCPGNLGQGAGFRALRGKAQGFVCRKWPCRTRPGPARSEDGPPGGVTNGCRGGASTLIWTIWFQNRRARHPQQSARGPGNVRARGPGGASATTAPAPEDRRAPPAVHSTSPPLGPSQTQESMPPLAAAAPLGAPTFWVPGTASGVCVGQPLMFFVIQPSPMALQPSEKPPPPPQVAVPWAACSPADTAPWQPGPGAILPPLQPETHIRRRPESPVAEGTAPLL
ncbi:unnamed protein product, partial [Rangifer tarandus platyrhynchus]|uniref:Uncharacterized protein n=1 Tax=Rangifer tarandus platyrhynchus TaxID=3082113 RepID=A0AC59YMK8_RANTA